MNKYQTELVKVVYEELTSLWRYKTSTWFSDLFQYLWIICIVKLPLSLTDPFLLGVRTTSEGIRPRPCMKSVTQCRLWNRRVETSELPPVWRTDYHVYILHEQLIYSLSSPLPTFIYLRTCVRTLINQTKFKKLIKVDLDPWN